MRCALVVPAWTPEEIFSSSTASSQINYWQPLGTLYVASALREAGHEVIFLNGAFMRNEEILSRILAFRPEAVGVYSTTFGWEKAKAFARKAKDIVPRAFAFAGGPYPIAAQAKCLGDCPDMDAVVTGEGELTCTEMLGRLASGRGMDGVLGVAYRKGGEVVENPPRPLIQDLDSIPFPARDLLGDAGRYIPPPPHTSVSPWR